MVVSNSGSPWRQTRTISTPKSWQNSCFIVPLRGLNTNRRPPGLRIGLLEPNDHTSSDRDRRSSRGSYRPLEREDTAQDAQAIRLSVARVWGLDPEACPTVSGLPWDGAIPAPSKLGAG